MNTNLMPVHELVNSQVDFFKQANTQNVVTWEKESQFAIQLLQANDYLANVARQNPAATQNAIINVAAIGVTLNPAMKHAYLVPRKGKVCLDISYMGLIDLACDSGSIRWAQAVIVRKNDNFRLTGLGERPIHDHSPFGDRGDIVGVYCTAKTSDGDYLTECMSIEDVYKIRDRSESYSKKKQGPWVSDPEEMIKKTVVKRAYKYWPKVERLATAIEYQNTYMGEGIELEPVMKHISDEEKAAESAAKEADLSAKVQQFIDQMELAQSEGELKNAFGAAFTATKQHQKMNQEVQSIYIKNKTRLGV